MHINLLLKKHWHLVHVISISKWYKAILSLIINLVPKITHSLDIVLTLLTVNRCHLIHQRKSLILQYYLLKLLCLNEKMKSLRIISKRKQKKIVQMSTYKIIQVVEEVFLMKNNIRLRNSILKIQKKLFSKKMMILG